jgi:hypothetical protein
MARSRWQSVKCLLSHWFADRPQVQIWPRLDRSQARYWQAYDPKSGQSFSATSAAEMRFWLEQRDRETY